jgi:hypothetical protein
MDEITNYFLSRLTSGSRRRLQQQDQSFQTSLLRHPEPGEPVSPPLARLERARHLRFLTAQDMAVFPTIHKEPIFVGDPPRIRA